MRYAVIRKKAMRDRLKTRQYLNAPTVINMSSRINPADVARMVNDRMMRAVWVA